MMSAAYDQLFGLLATYKSVLPLWTFPYLPLTIAAAFQSLAWLSGPILLSSLTLGPRMLVLIAFACGEYLFMSPSMNAAVEVLGMPEPMLVIIYQVLTLVVYAIIHVTVFKKKFHLKYVVSFTLLACAVYVAHAW
jgi:uncharacterized protein (DUF486 family)